MAFSYSSLYGRFLHVVLLCVRNHREMCSLFSPGLSVFFYAPSFTKSYKPLQFTRPERLKGCGFNFGDGFLAKKSVCCFSGFVLHRAKKKSLEQESAHFLQGFFLPFSHAQMWLSGYWKLGSRVTKWRGISEEYSGWKFTIGKINFRDTCSILQMLV